MSATEVAAARAGTRVATAARVSKTSRTATLAEGLKAGTACQEEAAKAMEAAEAEVAAESFPTEKAAMARPATRVCRVVRDVAGKRQISKLGFGDEGEESDMHANWAFSWSVRSWGGRSGQDDAQTIISARMFAHVEMDELLRGGGAEVAHILEAGGNFGGNSFIFFLEGCT